MPSLAAATATPASSECSSGVGRAQPDPASQLGGAPPVDLLLCRKMPGDRRLPFVRPNLLLDNLLLGCLGGISSFLVATSLAATSLVSIAAAWNSPQAPPSPPKDASSNLGRVRAKGPQDARDEPEPHAPPLFYHLPSLKAGGAPPLHH